MVISRKKNPYSQPLYLNGAVLDQVESFKYLGVNISHDLTWSKYRLDDGFEVSTGFRSPRKPMF